MAAGADPNDTLPDGASALVLAAHSGQGNVAIALLEKGADPNAMGIGYTAMHAAVVFAELALMSQSRGAAIATFGPSIVSTTWRVSRRPRFSPELSILAVAPMTEPDFP